jgi:8-oxo-dGTP diphosphatase
MIDVVAALIWNDNNEVLIAKRNYAKSMGGLWEFPGGKIEGKETPEESLVREIKEELNIDIRVESYFATNVHDYGEFEIKLIAYNAKLIRGELIPKEHEEIQWVTPKELENYEFAPADIPFITNLNLETK